MTAPTTITPKELRDLASLFDDAVPTCAPTLDEQLRSAADRIEWLEKHVRALAEALPHCREGEYSQLYGGSACGALASKRRRTSTPTLDAHERAHEESTEIDKAGGFRPYVEKVVAGRSWTIEEALELALAMASATDAAIASTRETDLQVVHLCAEVRAFGEATKRTLDNLMPKAKP